MNIAELKTTNLFGNAEISFPLTTAIKNMLVPVNQGIQTEPENPNQSHETKLSSPNCKAENTCTVCVTNQINQDITTRLYGNKDTKEILINPSKTECWKEVVIKSGEDFERMTWGVGSEGNLLISQELTLEACRTYNKIVKK